MALTVHRLNHVNQVLAPYEQANAFYRDVFGAVQYLDSYDEGEDRDASLLAIGATPIELFAPRGDTSLLGAGLARSGPAFHSFELQVDDLDRARAEFVDRGVRLTTDRPGSFFMTHPKDCHGLLFEICDFPMTDDPRLETNWSEAPWSQGPLGLQGTATMGVAVRDVEAASAFVRDVTGGQESLREKRSGVGLVSAVSLPDFVIELIEPDDDASPVAAFIQRYGTRIRSLDFTVRDPDAVRRHLEGHGLRVAGGDVPGQVALDPQDNYGVLYQFAAPR